MNAGEFQAVENPLRKAAYRIARSTSPAGLCGRICVLFGWLEECVSCDLSADSVFCDVVLQLAAHAESSRCYSIFTISRDSSPCAVRSEMVSPT
jgi:hypothetical protein